MENSFRLMYIEAGVIGKQGARWRPRVHDLHHTAAQHRVEAWYRDGEDVQHMLPQFYEYAPANLFECRGAR